MDMQNEDHIALFNKFRAYGEAFSRFNEHVTYGVLTNWMSWRLEAHKVDKVRDLEYPVAVALWNDMLMAWPLGQVEINDPDLKPMPVEYRRELPEITPEWATALHNRLMAQGFTSALSDADFMKLMMLTRHD